MSQNFISKGETLHYIVHADIIPTNFSDNQELHLYQLSFNVASFEVSDFIVFFKLKSFLIDIPWWLCTETFDMR